MELCRDSIPESGAELPFAPQPLEQRYFAKELMSGSFEKLTSETSTWKIVGNPDSTSVAIDESIPRSSKVASPTRDFI